MKGNGIICMKDKRKKRRCDKMSTYDVILPPLKGDIAKKFWQAYHASGITQEAIDKANKSRERIAKQGFKPNK